MHEKAILSALAELDRWKRREADLRAETDKASRQVAYYEALVREMKKEVRPARLSDLLKSMATLFRL